MSNDRRRRLLLLLCFTVSVSVSVLGGCSSEPDGPTVPTENHETPVENHETPVENHETPVENHETPVENHETPVENHGEAPEISIVSGPDALTNATVATFELSCNLAEGCTFRCEFNEEELSSCASTMSFEDLEDGEHIFTARAVDARGATSAPARWSWTVDTVSPDVVDLSGPTGVTNETTALFDFACSKEDCTFLCELTGSEGAGEAVPCESGVSHDDLDDDTYTMSVRAVDRAGNVGNEVTLSWTVDTIPPEIENLVGPADLTMADRATLSFDCSEASCEFTCELLSSTATVSAQMPCESGVSYEDLADDDYLFIVRATDLAGNVGAEARYSWTVTREEPVIALTAQTRLGFGEFDFSCTNKPVCTFECALERDEGEGFAEEPDWQPCTSSYTAEELEVGDYRFSVRATDGAGNQAMRAHAWAVVFSGWSALATGRDHTCGIGADSTLWCWGAGEYYRLGLGSNINDRVSPQQVSAGTSRAEGWTAVAAGTTHSCALREDTTLWCWGDNTGGRLGVGSQGFSTTPIQVGAGTEIAQGWTAVVTGAEHTCGLRADETLWCWGRGANGQLGHGLTTGRLIPIQVGVETELEQGWIAVAAGSAHTCAVRDDATLWCWGAGSSGRLGIDDVTDQTTPRQVAEGTALEQGWRTVATGSLHSCATRDDDTLWCWGHGTFGRLGLGDDLERTTPHQVAAGTGLEVGWVDVTAGLSHSCALRDDESLWCWGQGSLGRLGLGDADDRIVPTEVMAPSPLLPRWKSVDAGGFHGCAIGRDGALTCWGSNGSGQVGSGEPSGDKRVPWQLDSPLHFFEVAAGGRHGCGVATDTSLWCWGNGLNGSLGLGDGNSRAKPHQVDAGGPLEEGWVSVKVGNGHTCALRDDTTLWCWGQGNYGQLGLGVMASHDTPQQVGAGSAIETGWSALSLGSLHTCALRDDASLWCWGQGYGGKLGLGHTNDTLTPAQVAKDSNIERGWRHVATGENHTCAIRDDETLWCWGHGQYGKHGLGDTTQRNAPVQVAAGTDLEEGWVALATGDHHSCAIRADETLWCWGRGSSGQLGLGTTDVHYTPQQSAVGLAIEQGWHSLSLGASHTCAVRNDDALWCWGLGLNGRLGIGSTTSQNRPQKVGDGIEWSSVAAGNLHTHGLEADGTIWSWGSNTNGLLGDGTAWKIEPVEVAGP